MPTKPLDWDKRIGRRVRLRDLHILFTAVQNGSMAKASVQLGMSQSAVSQAIAALEHAVEVPLLDRTSRGVELTMYGAALMRRGEAAFDELRLGIKDIEQLTDPEVGEVRIACTESMAAGIIPAVIERFSLRYPRVHLHVFQTGNHPMGYAALHERKADVLLTLSPRPVEGDQTEHLRAEVLFYDRICLAAATESSWARRRKLTPADLVGAVLISPPTDTPGGTAVIEAFRAAGLPRPLATVTTFSVHVRNGLSMRGRFIAVLPVSILRFNPSLFSLKELPLNLPMEQFLALIVTLRSRTLSPPVERFIECARDIARAMHARVPSRKLDAMQNRAAKIKAATTAP